VIKGIDALTFAADGDVVKGIVNVKLGGDFYTTAAEMGTLTVGKSDRPATLPHIVISGTDSSYDGGTLNAGLKIMRNNVTLDHVRFNVTGSESQTFVYSVEGDKAWHSLVWVNADNVRIVGSEINFTANNDNASQFVNVAVAVAGTLAATEGNPSVKNTVIESSTISVTAAGTNGAHGLAILFGDPAKVANNIITGTVASADNADDANAGTLYLDSPVSALLVGDISKNFTLSSDQADNFSGNTLNGYNFDFYLYQDEAITGSNFGSKSTTFSKSNTTSGVGVLLNKLVNNSKFDNNYGFGVILGGTSAYSKAREQYKIQGKSIINFSYWDGDDSASGSWGSLKQIDSSSNGAKNEPESNGFYITRTINRAPAGTAGAGGSTATNPK
jgi:hypothetical protein